MSAILYIRQKGGQALLLPLEFYIFVSSTNMQHVKQVCRHPLQALYFSRNWSAEKCVTVHSALSLFMYSIGLTLAVSLGSFGHYSAAIAVNPHYSIMLLYGVKASFIAYLPITVVRLVLFDSIGYQLGRQGATTLKATKVLTKFESIEKKSRNVTHVVDVLAYVYLFLKNSFTAMLIMGSRGKRWETVLVVNILGTVTIWTAVYFYGPRVLSFVSKLNIPYVPMV